MTAVIYARYSSDNQREESIEGDVYKRQALFNAYENKDLSAFLMAICQHSMFDLLRNAAPVSYTHLDVYKRQRLKMQDLFFFITSLCQKFNQPFPCQNPA